jgi:hypothetical protein
VKKARVTGEQTFFVPGPLPGMNELIDARMLRSRTRSKRGKLWNAYTKLKREWEAMIVACIKQAGVQPVKSSIYLIYTFIEENKRRDKSNVAAAGIKLVEDSLVIAGIIPNDGWKWIENWHCRFMVRKGKNQKAGVGVQIFPDGG